MIYYLKVTHRAQREVYILRSYKKIKRIYCSYLKTQKKHFSKMILCINYKYIYSHPHLKCTLASGKFFLNSSTIIRLLGSLIASILSCSTSFAACCC